MRGGYTNTIGKDKRIKYVAAVAAALACTVAFYYYPAEAFMAFVLWLSPGVPVILIVILIYRLFFEKRRTSYE